MNSYEIRENFVRISYEFHVNSREFTQMFPVCTPLFVLTPLVGAPACTPVTGNNGLGLCGDLMSISCYTGTAAVESKGTACRLEAVFV